MYDVSLLKITIDTSVVAEENSTTIQYLVEAHEKKLLDVAVASRFMMDKENDPDPERVERQKRIVEKLNLVPSTLEIIPIYGMIYLQTEGAMQCHYDMKQNATRTIVSSI